MVTYSFHLYSLSSHHFIQYVEIFSHVSIFQAQLVVSWNARRQVTFADYALNHLFLRSVAHKLFSDT